MSAVINTINFGILIFFIFSAFVYTLILIGATSEIFNIFKYHKLTNLYSLINTIDLPPVTIIIPLHNEAQFTINNVLSALNSTYKNFYVLLVNDGSTDTSLALLKDQFALVQQPMFFEKKIKTAEVNTLYISQNYPNLLLIDKVQSGVGDSLNAALNICFTPYFMTLDSDSIIDPEAVTELMISLLTYDNAIGIGGGVYILNACQYRQGKMIASRMPYRLVPALQAVEYLRSHVFNRTGWNVFGSTMSYSGTASLFNLSRVLRVRGYDTNNFAQDTEMVMRLHHGLQRKEIPYQIRFNPLATVWTDVPKTLREYSIQRERWQRGIIKSALNYWRMFLNPKYKAQGMFSYPTYMLLDVIAPLVEFTAYFTLPIAYFFGLLDGVTAILYILLAWGFSAYLTMANTFISTITFNRYENLRDILWTLLLSVIEICGFRQYHTLVKVWGTIHYFYNRLRGKAI